MWRLSDGGSMVKRIGRTQRGPLRREMKKTDAEKKEGRQERK